MNEEAAQGVDKPTAGRLLREAREKQGLHVAALAAAIKVAPKKLEALESDRFEELPDATFARALAQTVCRALKIDAAPIMRLLPPLAGHRLEQLGEGLNTPFRDRPDLHVQSDWKAFALNPWVWVVFLLLVAAAAVYLLPGHLIDAGAARLRPSAAASASSVVEPAAPPGPRDAVASASDVARVRMSAGPTADAAPATAADEPASEPASIAGDGATAPAAADAGASATEAAAGVLQLRSTAPSWIEVTDARGKTLISRVVTAGEAIALDGTAPFKLTIGNASATQVVLRGKPVALGTFSRDNVARLELR